ncbi:CD151 antigen-like isoform X2 [Bradysia coprophila]|uniref:CD151 antigen-like isoform X2 n=1 Tax=Bradysia coprophila TaxID=38358 RepID=UPI00187DCE56|nr:CD151 antigen-like isoform X2 [Bradysia coprophila]
MDVNRERNKEKLNFGLTCTKYILFLLNVVFVIASVLAISSGISTIVAFTSYYYMMAYGFNALTTLWLVVGIIFLIVALVGIFTAFKESTALSNIYAVLMMVVFILQIAVSIYSFTLINQIQDMVSYQLRSMMTHYSYDSQVEVDWIQSNFQCCGIRDPQDWLDFEGGLYYANAWNNYHSFIDSQLNETGIRMPVSCCKPFSNYVNLKCEHYHSSGCFDAIYQIVSASIMMFGTSSLIVSILQLLGIILGFYFARLVRGKKTQRDMQIWNTNQENSTSARQETDYSPIQW